MSRITQDTGIDKTEAKDQPKVISVIFEQIKKAINNGLTFSDNFDGKISEVSFTTADTNTSVSHGLGRVPSGYLVLNRSANMVVYDGSSAATSSTFYLRSSAQGTCSVLFF